MAVFVNFDWFGDGVCFSSDVGNVGVLLWYNFLFLLLSFFMYCGFTFFSCGFGVVCSFLCILKLLGWWWFALLLCDSFCMVLTFCRLHLVGCVCCSISYLVRVSYRLIETASLWDLRFCENGGRMLSLMSRKVFDLPTGVSLSYFWCGGFMLGFFLVLQVISGVVLSFFYVAQASNRFGCVLGITNDGLFGWLVRYTHVWGVRFIFILLFAHIGRSLYYSSYTKQGVWKVGFLIYLLMMVEAFLGYVLPWHQMSYWAATVLTSIIQVVPFFGSLFYKYVVGGFSVAEVTLIRVFSLHVCLAFLILGLVGLHLFYLHQGGSKKPLFCGGGYGDFVLFHSYFVKKDGFVLFSLLRLFFFCIWVVPDFVLDVESFVEADPLVTPVSIKPEWYFLAFYAMLRSVRSKLGGLVLVVLFLFMVWLPSFKSSCVYEFDRQIVFWGISRVFVGLRFLGSCHPESPFVVVRWVFSFMIIFLFSLFKGYWLVEFSWFRVKRLFLE